MSGQFIGDYQGLVADDKVAIPFWNDTQAAGLSPGAKGYSPWQEVYAARIPATKKPKSCPKGKRRGRDGRCHRIGGGGGGGGDDGPDARRAR